MCLVRTQDKLQQSHMFAHKIKQNDQNARTAQRNTIKSHSQAKGADMQPPKTSKTTFSLVQQGSCQCWGPCYDPRNIRRQQLN